MDILKRFRRSDEPVTFAGRKKPVTEAVPVPVGVKGGRTSQPESTSLLGFLTNELAQVEPDFELGMIRIIEHLAKYNGDVSYAVDNVVQLANTPYSIYFGDAVPEDKAKEMALICKEGEKEVYSGKLNALINDLYAQAVISGAVSGEIVPNRKLDDVLKIVLVATGSIKFVYDAKKVDYIPHQKTTATGVRIIGEGLKALNPVTYKYYALRRFGEKPYAIPPLLSALESIAIEKEMIQGLKSIVKKLGVFGFMTMLITPPKKKVGMGVMESDEAYWARCEQHLTQVRAEAEKGFASGLVLGFKDSHEIKLENTLANMTGTRELFNLIGEFKFAGLKQDPLMLGRNYNVAETMARVILAKLTTQIKNYQLTVGSFLEDYFTLKLLLRGYNEIGNLKVEFEPAMVSDKKLEEDAYGKRIQNQRELFNDGVIDQNTRAQALGFEQAAEDAPRPAENGYDKYGNPNPVKATPSKDNPTKVDDKNKSKVSNENQSNFNFEELELSLGASLPLFSYNKGLVHRYHDASFAVGNSKLHEFLDEYFRETKTVYSSATRAIAQKAAAALQQLGPGASQEMVYDKVMYVLFKNWSKSFNQPIKQIIARNVTSAYQAFRNDTSVLSGKEAKPAKFGPQDLRTIDYTKLSDALYLGKFITDEDTKKKIREFIKDQYMNGKIPFDGMPASVVEAFRQEFAGLLDMQDWKIVNILSTSVNKLQNYAALSYMDQMGIETFEVRGIIDSRQCSTCRAMQGKQFSVATALQRVDNEISSAPEYVGVIKPFATSVFKGEAGLRELESLDSSAIQARGIDTPPFHGNCRDRIYAVA